MFYYIIVKKNTCQNYQIFFNIQSSLIHFIDYDVLKQPPQTFILIVYISVNISTLSKSKHFFRIIKILEWVKIEAFSVQLIPNYMLEKEQQQKMELLFDKAT